MLHIYIANYGLDVHVPAIDSIGFNAFHMNLIYTYFGNYNFLWILNVKIKQIYYLIFLFCNIT